MQHSCPTARPPKVLARVESALRLAPMTAQELCKATCSCRAAVDNALTILRRGHIVGCLGARRMTGSGSLHKVGGIR